MATEVDPLAFQKGFQATQSVFDSAQRNRLQDLAMAQQQQQLGRQNALASIVGNAANYDEAGNLRRSALPQIAQADPASYPTYRKQITEQDAAGVAAQKAKRDELLSWVNYSEQRMANVNSPETWAAFKQQAGQVFPEYAARLPDQYDPAALAQARANAVPLLDRLKMEQQRDIANQNAETARRGQDIGANTAAAGRDVTMRGQDITLRGQDLTNARAADANAVKTTQAQQERVRDANDALGLLDQAEKLIPQATGSYIGAGRDMALRTIGAATGGGNAAAQLRALEGALVSKMPKMSGPQSDKDVAMYRQMAGQIGDATIPPETKLAAIKTIREIQNKYAGNAAPAAGAPVAQDAAIQELRRRAASDPALAEKLKAMGY